MNLEHGVILSAILIVFSGGAAWGVVRQSLKSVRKEIIDMQNDIEKLSDCDSIVRRYLFADTGMTVYMPAEKSKGPDWITG